MELITVFGIGFAGLFFIIAFANFLIYVYEEIQKFKKKKEKVVEELKQFVRMPQEESATPGRGYQIHELFEKYLSSEIEFIPTYTTAKTRIYGVKHIQVSFCLERENELFHLTGTYNPDGIERVFLSFAYDDETKEIRYEKKDPEFERYYDLFIKKMFNDVDIIERKRSLSKRPQQVEKEEPITETYADEIFEEIGKVQNAASVQKMMNEMNGKMQEVITKLKSMENDISKNETSLPQEQLHRFRTLQNDARTLLNIYYTTENEFKEQMEDRVIEGLEVVLKKQEEIKGMHFKMKEYELLHRIEVIKQR